MLIIERDATEGFFIGRTVRVTVLEIRGKTVKFGVEAPPHVAVSRDDFSFEDHMQYQLARERKHNGGVDSEV